MGVCYLFENLWVYLDFNFVGIFNIMEVVCELSVDYLLMVLILLVYGVNEEMFYFEIDKIDMFLMFYVVMKKVIEVMVYFYVYFWNLLMMMFWFFMVYGFWGCLDMVLFKFVDGILEDCFIDIYNNGDMYCDFIYVEDLVCVICLLIDVVFVCFESVEDIVEGDSLLLVVLFWIVNIGNFDKVCLLDFVDVIEVELGKLVIWNYMLM